MWVKSQDRDIGKNFQNRIAVALETILRSEKWNYIKFKPFCSERKQSPEKRQAKE